MKTRMFLGMCSAAIWMIFTPAGAAPPEPLNTGPTFGTEGAEADIPKLLGPLGSDLAACFSMDGPPRGSVVFSPANNPVLATFSGVSFGRAEGRQSADFSQPNAALRLVNPLAVGPAYTLAVWLKLPLPNRHGVVWQSQNGTPLYLTADKFMCWTTRAHELAPIDPALAGWHHVAVACNGSETAFYLDGAPQGTVSVAVDGALKTIGNHLLPAQAANSQCDRLDDMFVFNRALSAAEITALLPIRLPQNAPQNAPQNLSRFAPAAPTATSPDLQNTTADLVNEFRNTLVFVSGEGAGSGFIVQIGGKNFLATNAHVAAGVKGAAFRTLEGQPIKVGAASVAAGHDIFMMQAPPGGHPMEVMTGVDQNTRIGDDVVVLGNAAGAGVINTITGKIVGVGPNLVEVDAAFQPGNSGSPIVHLKSKKVIGVATYLTIRKYDPATQQPVKNPIVRRFGYRLDSVKAWQPVQWPAFAAQAAEMETIEKLTTDFIAFINDIAEDSRVSRDRHTNPAIRGRIDSWLSAKSRKMSAVDRVNADQNFLSFLKVTCHSDIQAANQRMTFDYFQRGLAEQQKERIEIAEIFTKIIKSIQSDR